MNIVAIIPARGGSKGIPRKNLINICGQPLIYWSISNALNTKLINSVWVTSDDNEIISISKKLGASTIRRPKELSNSNASSESAWIHAINEIENKKKIDLVVAIQPTSPIRESVDLSNAIKIMKEKKLDSLFSASAVKDRFIWVKDKMNKYIPYNHDMYDRRPRQKMKEKYLENGSFWIFKPDIIKKENNRLGGKIGCYVMDFYKSFQIDEYDDIKLCESVMKSFIF